MRISQNVGRFADRVDGQPIARFRPIKTLADARYERLLRRYADRLPELSPDDRELVDMLDVDPLRVTSLDELALPGTDVLWEGLDRLVNLLRARPVLTGTVRPSTDELLEDPRVWQFGLGRRMLDVAENYLGMPARYLGADVRREVADAAANVRRWHRDVEERRTLSILVLLNDVDEDVGPFVYISAARSAEAVDRLGRVARFPDDDAMRSLIPETEWRTWTGPRGTAVVADRCRLPHRAVAPRAGDRFSVTYSWGTRHPARTMPQRPMTDAQVRRAATGLGPRQIACLPPVLLRQLNL
ncbi:hypothetical protein GCM10023169_40920 [Georgenia halophila]|uniref:Fe2OG dioxygenase domain-containing protein n=1 Tax=Georgenia halophila TaxID=620889 RepID=A0ABP8LQ69_9MICO